MPKKKQIKDEEKNYLISFIILIIVPFIVYIQATNFSFVWDDLPLYINNQHFPADNPLKNIFSFFIPKSNEMYIPITYFFWSILAFISGATEFNPVIFHLTNILVHIINTILIFFILRLLFKELWLSFFGAILFSIHPIQVESVVWVSELRGLLSGFFGFLAIYLYLLTFNKNGIKTNVQKNQKSDIIEKSYPTKKYYIYVCISILLSFLSKPSGIVFPFIIFFIDLFFLRSTLKEAIKRIWFLFILIIPAIIITIVSESESKVDLSINILNRFLVFLDAVGFYIKQVIYPLNLAVNYGRSPSYIVQNDIIGIIIHSALALTLLLIFFFKKNKQFLGGYFIFIVGFLPLSGLVTFYYQLFSTVADRYLYFSMLGTAIIFVSFFKEIKRVNTRYIFATVYCIVLLIVTFNHLPNWKDEISLWGNTIKKYPEISAYSYFARGNAFMEQNKTKEALLDFSKAIRLDTTLELAYYNRGNLYYDIRNYSAAIADFTFTIKLNPKNLNALINRGLAYLEINLLNEAITDFSSALNIDSTLSDVYVNRGIAFAKRGNKNEAIKDFKQALKINPEDDIAKENLKIALESINGK